MRNGLLLSPEHYLELPEACYVVEAAAQLPRNHPEQLHGTRHPEALV
jgi:hypothetical protein